MTPRWSTLQQQRKPRQNFEQPASHFTVNKQQGQDRSQVMWEVDPWPHTTHTGRKTNTRFLAPLTWWQCHHALTYTHTFTLDFYYFKASCTVRLKKKRSGCQVLWEGLVGSEYLMSTWFLFEKMEKFWTWVTSVHLWWLHKINVLNATELTIKIIKMIWSCYLVIVHILCYA